MKKSDYIEQYASDGSFPDVSEGKESACNAGHPGLIPGLGRSPGEGNGNPFQFLPGEFRGQRSLAVYSPWSYKELDTTEQLALLLSLSHSVCISDGQMS